VATIGDRAPTSNATSAASACEPARVVRSHGSTRSRPDACSFAAAGNSTELATLSSACGLVASSYCAEYRPTPCMPDIAESTTRSIVPMVVAATFTPRLSSERRRSSRGVGDRVRPGSGAMAPSLRR
jgi:hypothetical protein